jgi:hypothetical protein
MYIEYMKSNKDQANIQIASGKQNLHEELSTEKEMLVTMFLSSASQHELTEQIKKIDNLCSRIDIEHRKKPLH